MDENEKNIVSFENPVGEPEPVRTVEIEYPRTDYEEPVHAAPTGPSHSKQKEKKYVKRLENPWQKINFSK